jgi:rhodanese-related sulfurtransferase
MRLLGILLLFGIFSFAESLKELQQLQFQDVAVTHTYKERSKDVIITREIAPVCQKYHVTPETVHGEIYDKMESLCKRTLVTTLGKVQPFGIFGLQTIGELEVLAHIKKTLKEPDKYVLADVRKEEWYDIITIPSAVNIPYPNIAYDADFPEDHQKLLQTFNITYKEGKYQFKDAKTAVIFCNGAWCAQSSKAIKELLAIGYPKEKLLWYRGGIQQWMNLSFTTIRGDLK